MEHTEIAIIGAGPTGLGAALRLLEVDCRNFLVIDGAETPGGLASSCVDSHGFTWDLGGHVQFSHYVKFDEYMDLAFPPQEWLWHERESWIWMRDRFLPYPFQNNLHRLNPEDRWKAVEGLLVAHQSTQTNAPTSLQDWIIDTFGSGIAELFLVPYNRKVWAHPLEQMDFRWVGERISVPSIQEVVKSVCLAQDQVSWGPNHRFRFPLRGGTGAIWRSLGARIPETNLRLSSQVKGIDASRRILTLSGGNQLRYESLLNTAPLNWLTCAIGDNDLAAAADQLKSSTVHVVGIGMEGQPHDLIRKMCWMYFPGDDCDFYRVTVFSNYSPSNVPKPGATWSLMAEVSESSHRPVDRVRLVDNVTSQMVSAGLIQQPASIISRWHKTLTPGYPTPSLGRDAVLARLFASLELRRIYSRGRFGAWKYEIGNQDHSFMQGVEAADHILGGRSEVTLHHPDFVNQRYNTYPQAEDQAA